MQVPAGCYSPNAKEYELSSAILMYAEKRSKQMVFASFHDVAIKGKTATIQPGLAVSKTGLVEALRSLVPEDFTPAELLEENILARGNDHLAWYSKPGKRQVWFDCPEFGKVTALADHPGLVFIVSKNGWYVFAFKGDSRPSPQTKLFVASYFNVWQYGKICVGNIDPPKGAMKFRTEAWEEAWWRSTFTHPNQHEKGALTKYRGGIFALWRKLLAGKPFPQESLVPANETLEQAFRRTVQHG